jgi:hypothetical protein
MKFIERLFELMVKYQEFKYILKSNYEKLRVELRLYYAEKTKDLHS